ncbi:Bax inhibitor-1/YccA family protein [Pseudochelatococcus sp. G4_1912]|uniref:Bax inhibitor-1/YccA family protein n=1 Tax=Pseudochelatococcus sp. G4_1912 TaxID=3114288 RepID=UPI0039C6E665
MSDWNRNAPAYGQDATRAGSAELDQGLRAFMLGVYNNMVLGLAITGLAALGIFMAATTSDQATAVASVGGGLYLTQFGYALFASPLKWVVILAPLAMVFFISFRIEKLQAGTARMLFLAYAALMGVSISSIFLIYTQASIVQVFFVTAAAFGALSLYGYTTKRNLSAMGSFLIMGLFGLIIASLVNLFLQSSGFQFVISVLGVLIFAGLTAWDTQRIKEMYYALDGGEVAAKKSVLGALSLYLNFINMFMFLLQLFGQQRSN